MVALLPSPFARQFLTSIWHFIVYYLWGLCKCSLASTELWICGADRKFLGIGVYNHSSHCSKSPYLSKVNKHCSYSVALSTFPGDFSSSSVSLEKKLVLDIMIVICQLRWLLLFKCSKQTTSDNFVVSYSLNAVVKPRVLCGIRFFSKVNVAILTIFFPVFFSLLKVEDVLIISIHSKIIPCEEHWYVCGVALKSFTRLCRL